MIAQVDDDGSGDISKNEFLDMMVNKIENEDPYETLFKAFRLFDKDARGYLDAEDIKRVAIEV